METNAFSHNDQLPGEMTGGTFAKPMPVLDAILYYNLKQINRQDLIRSLLSFRKWFAPLDLYSYEGRPTRSFEQTIVLSPERISMGDEVWIFTDDEAASHAAQQKPFLGSFVGGISGTELFRSLPSKTKIVRVNPHSTPELALTLTGDDLYEVRSWTSVTAFEDNFAEWKRTGKPDKVDFNNYTDFYVFDHSTGPIITLPNREGMSNPAAAFTAPDCARLFLSKVDEKQRGEMKPMKVHGSLLLERRQIMGIDGLIINVYGPGATYALSFDSLDPKGSPANSVKNAFVILYFLASADGEFDVRETQIINDFLGQQHGAINFDVRQTMSELEILRGDERLKEYDAALLGYKNGSTVEERMKMLRFAADIVAADGSISKGEKALFQDIARVWEIDLQKFFAQMGISAAPQSPPQPPNIPGLTFVRDPLISSSPPVQEQTDKLSQKVHLEHITAWRLGNLLSLYAIAATQADANLSESHFKEAKTMESAIGSTLKTLTGMSENPAENYARITEYLLNSEGLRLAAKLDETYGAPISDYFLMIVKCRLLTLMYRPGDATGRDLAEIALTEALSHRHLTVIPEAYFGQLISAVKRGVERELLIAVVEDFYESVRAFFFSRL